MSEASSHGPAAPRVSSATTKSLYPVFQRGAGRGSGGTSGSAAPRGRGRGSSSSQPQSDARFGALNALALELQSEGAVGLGGGGDPCGDEDEGDGNSEAGGLFGGEGDEGDRVETTGRLQEDDELERDASQMGSDNEDDEDRGSAALRRAQGGSSGGHRARKRFREDDFEGAAMGAGSKRRAPGRAPSDSGSASGRSMDQSAQQRETAQRVFPVPGLRCLCCSLAHRLGPVDSFVDENCTRLEETALFKFAALVFAEKIAAPIEAEGVPVPKPSWEQIRAHYLHHVAHPKMQRAGVVKQLAMMRAKVSERLVRFDDSDPTGRGELDKNSADLLLKILAQESKERELLFAPAKGGIGRRAPGNSATADE